MMRCMYRFSANQGRGLEYSLPHEKETNKQLIEKRERAAITLSNHNKYLEGSLSLLDFRKFAS